MRVYQGVVAFDWKDSKPVHFLSTAHYPDEVATVQCQQKEQRSGQYSEKEVQSHKIVVDYSANMGAVDTNEQTTTVRKSRKQLHWHVSTCNCKVSRKNLIQFLQHRGVNSESIFPKVGDRGISQLLERI